MVNDDVWLISGSTYIIYTSKELFLGLDRCPLDQTISALKHHSTAKVLFWNDFVVIRDFSSECGKFGQKSPF